MLAFVTVAGALVGVTRIDTFAVALRFARTAERSLRISPEAS